MANPWLDPAFASRWAERLEGGDPLRDLLLETLCRLAAVGAPRRVLELGIGAGFVTESLHALLPGAELVGVDASAAMLELARGRRCPARLVLSDFLEDWPSRVGGPFDLVVSALSIHHVEGAAKKDVYAKAFAVLEPGGRFLNGERLAVEPELFEHYRVLWRHLAERIGMDAPPEDWSWERYRERLAESGDAPERLEVQLGWLREVGFDPVTCFWQEADRAVFGGVRPR